MERRWRAKGAREMRRRQRAAETGATVEAASGARRARREAAPETTETAETAAIALGGGMFSPGQPIRPTPGLSGLGGAPRQWAFPPGYNIAQFPRATEQTSFAQLRGLAALYDGIQLCERVYFDLLGRLEPHVLPRAELLAAGEDAAAPRWREPARRIEAFLESPDRAQDLRSWLVAFVRDLLEIDAVAIYSRRVAQWRTLRARVDRGGHRQAAAGWRRSPATAARARLPAVPVRRARWLVLARRAGLHPRDGAHRKPVWPLARRAHSPARQPGAAQAGLRPGALH